LFKLNGARTLKGVIILKILVLTLLVLAVVMVLFILALVTVFKLFINSADTSASELEYMTKDGRFREEVFPTYPTQPNKPKS